MSGHAANQMRKAVYMAEFMAEMNFSIESAWEAGDETKKLVAAAAAERMELKTGRPKVEGDKLNLKAVRMPSDDTWKDACTHLQHMYDSDRSDPFVGV